MWSAHALEVIDAVARTGSFSSAAEELHRVPSAISYTVKQVEGWLAVPIFERRHRDVILTEAGEIFIKQSRSVIKKMIQTRHQCQQAANGWRGQFSIAVDCIVKPQRTQQLILDFYRHFPDIELYIHPEVFNGVWDALADERVDVAIGATRASPIGERYSFRDMGFMSWLCVASPNHPLAQLEGKLTDDQMRAYPSLCLEDTSRNLPKRDTWALDNQRRLVVPFWENGIACLVNELCVGMVPEHRAAPLCQENKLVQLQLTQPFPPSPCCLTWVEKNTSPALSWLLDYLGDSETLNAEWLAP
ncbi:DNA-binding transcriptional LysR family regulator [Providencia alcalifaciens]|nr:DNA-binding transcriptional LysR family regulator [Providencia alcalifaciens]